MFSEPISVPSPTGEKDQGPGHVWALWGGMKGGQGVETFSVEADSPELKWLDMRSEEKAVSSF